MCKKCAGEIREIKCKKIYYATITFVKGTR
jgi:hypothetical protein